MNFRFLNTTQRLVRPTINTFRVALPAFQTAGFHAGRILSIQPTKAVRDGASYIKGTVNDPVELPARDKVAGAYHWDFERLLAVGLIPLTIASVVNGAHPITDLALGIALPIHAHIGYDAIVTDYLPARRNPILYKVSTWGLRGATLLVLVGCYQFNTNDIGMAELVKRAWHA
ncbi:3541_t:CDS:2 [Ambispora gerdemannii]|uniref:Succinate dehydrogenase [ubiquinone] cytochrome b small subunit n=1 Tax=Ambispora gerdemannii TaxID=144530 RepID=A0A9N8ZRF7_9GLOM|nr:3541_t:CDS:2 [Ambispora gerdemannii]